MTTSKNRLPFTFLFILILFPLKLIYAQSCSDPNRSGTCECLPGLTNAPTCNTLACGNPFTVPSKRPALVPATAGDSGSKGCGKQCTQGFTGLNCNICQNTDACQSGLASLSSGSTPSPLSSTASQGLICSNDKAAYGVNFLQCELENPMLASLFPGRIWATAQRNSDPSSAPLPSDVISNLMPGTVVAQLWYAPNTSTPAQEQLYCTAGNCTQEIEDNIDYLRCNHIQCRCLPGTPVCGGGTLDLSNAINNINGDFTFECSTDNASDTCNLKTDVIKSIFGPKGFALSSCQFGECVQKSVADMKRQALLRMKSNQLGAGVIAGICVVLVVITALLALIVFGCWQQRRARNPPHPSCAPGSEGAACLTWRDLRYTLPTKRSTFAAYHRLPSPPPVESGPSDLRRSSLASNPLDIPSISDEKRSAYFLSGASSSVHLRPTPSPPLNDKNRHQPKQILRGLSGTVTPGTMMAILGPSGAGKSTFLDILAGQRKAGHITGSHSITIPGRSGNSSVTIGFVDQCDILPANSTVYEAIDFAAMLKLPEDVRQQERRDRVSEVIEMLGLSHVAHSRIGNDEVRGLSGGERRRLSIGLELISRPSILFLDEPTSGLDSVSAMRVVSVLKGLSTEAASGCGTTIVCSIHQPSSQIYYSFDYICLLAPGGRQVYCGETGKALDFIASYGYHCPAGYNPADYLLEVASDPSPSLFNQAAAYKEDGGSYPASIQSTPISYLAKTQPRTTVLTQFQTLSKREWQNLQRDPQLFWMHLAVAIVTGVFVGGMYFQVDITIAGFQNRIGSLFFLSAVIAFSALSALNNFIHVRLLFMRERAGRYYSPAAWLLSRLFFDLLPLRLVPALVMSLIMYFMVGLDHQADHVVKFLLVVVELSMVQTLYNLFLAAVFTQSGLAILFASLTNLIQLAFAGFFVNLNSITPVLKWVQYIAPLKFSLEAMTVNEVGSGLMIKDSLQGVNIQTSAAMIMDLLFGFKQDSYYRDVIVLFGFLIALAFLLVVTVYLRMRQTR